METIGIDEDAKRAILRTVAGILHLGNINLEANGDGSKVAKSGESALKTASEQLGWLKKK